MAHEVVWSSAAFEDVEAIAAYIARDSPHYATAEVQRLVEASRQLRLFPESGKRLPESSDPSLRELLVSTYRLIYRVGDAAVTIATVVHQKRSFELGRGRPPSGPNA